MLLKTTYWTFLVSIPFFVFLSFLFYYFSCFFFFLSYIQQCSGFNLAILVKPYVVLEIKYLTIMYYFSTYSISSFGNGSTYGVNSCEHTQKMRFGLGARPALGLWRKRLRFWVSSTGTVLMLSGLCIQCAEWILPCQSFYFEDKIKTIKI